MELGFFEVVGATYKIFAFFILGLVSIGSILFPIFISAYEDTPIPLLLYVLTPWIIAGCYKLMCLL